MLSSEHEVFEDITDTVEQALADKKIRMECEARERYERDRISLYASGRKTGFADAILCFIQTLQSDGISREGAIVQIVKYFNLTNDDATALVNEHWK